MLFKKINEKSLFWAWSLLVPKELCTFPSRSTPSGSLRGNDPPKGLIPLLLISEMPCDCYK